MILKVRHKIGERSIVYTKPSSASFEFQQFLISRVKISKITTNIDNNIDSGRKLDYMAKNQIGRLWKPVHQGMRLVVKDFQGKHFRQKHCFCYGATGFKHFRSFDQVESLKANIQGKFY